MTSTATLARPCLDADCGYLHRNPSGYCNDHQQERKRSYNAYGWRQLSKRLRARQPFCEICSRTTDLQLHHMPGAHERQRKGLRLVPGVHVKVVCSQCNNQLGAAR